ncbi:1 3-beta-glucanosyltransferase gel4 [Ciborinia camelliae]|nr:1 3-beta-glucanosyltransferase gel4 [Ciborinia camelliae]
MGERAKGVCRNITDHDTLQPTERSPRGSKNFARTIRICKTYILNGVSLDFFAKDLDYVRHPNIPVIAAAVLAGELSLCSALAAGHLASTACDFSGSAKIQSGSTSSTCSALISQAGTAGTGTVSSAPTGTGSSSPT